MLDINYIILPLTGGVIGYITNDIAIRMLFRPRTEKFIYGWHVPFTPGIIPKGKSRIADSIGKVISKELMNKDVLEDYLLSDEMIDKIRTAVENFIEKQKASEEIVREFLGHYLKDEDIDALSSNINNSFTLQMQTKLSDPAVGNKVAELAMNFVSDKMNTEGAQVLMGGLGGLLGGLPGMIVGPVICRLLGALREPAQVFLADNINNMLRDNGSEIVSNMIGDEVTSFLDKKVCVLLKGREEQLAHVADFIEHLYRNAIQDHLAQIIYSFDVSKMIRDRINEMDVKETEQLILQIIDKELNAIVWIGAMLGFLIGCLNILIC